MNLLSTFSVLVCCMATAASNVFPCGNVKDCMNTTLYHLPGPNPILAPRNVDDWQATECEVAGGVFKYKETYYIIYHCLCAATGYQVGISTASSPMGPWTPPSQPILALGKDGAWDNAVVASMNMMPHPSKPSEWLGWYEGGYIEADQCPDGNDECWTLGLASAPGPEGPWTKYPGNPILKGIKVCDKNRSFTGSCSGLYVAAVMHGEHTNHEYWMYVEAPINVNDEGPMALWTSKNPEGPWLFKAYVLDNGDKGGWDSGRYSESRVEYHGGLFHMFMTASGVGNPNPNKLVEQIGWAVSEDGIHFTEHPSNPLVPREFTTPHTIAMSEGHVWFEDSLVYVFHTLRWDDDADSFAKTGRNAEDLGVELLFPAGPRNLSMPLISLNWGLSLNSYQESPCAYGWETYRYCPILKTFAESSASSEVLRPAMRFKVQTDCQAGDGNVEVVVGVYSYNNATGVAKAPLSSMQLQGSCKEGSFKGETTPIDFSDSSDWVVATVTNTRNGEYGPLTSVQLDVTYELR